MEFTLQHSVVLLWVLFSLLLPSSTEKICPRDKSRVVGRVVREKIFPALNLLGVEPSDTCKFSLRRDIYAVQENNKVEESGNRWTCNICGKSFITEYFLDKHFENRHAEYLQTEDIVCLADVCDVFRCDIISGASKPDYWDIKLCLEGDMEELLSQCQALVNECIPAGLGTNETETLKGQMMDSVCSFLTCSRYWDRPYEGESSTHLALYIVLSTMTVFGIIIYNFVFYNYLYSDLGDAHYDPSPRNKYRMKKYQRSVESRRYPSQVSRHRGQVIEGRLH